MKSLSRRSAEREGGLPKWATTLDVVAVLMVLIAISVAISGGFRIWVFESRLSVTAWWRPALIAAIAIAIRHALTRQQPLHQRVMRGVVEWWRAPDTKVVLPIHLASRIGVLLVGFLAVILIGFPPEAANRWRIYSNELLDMPGRWDTGWYLMIATEGYQYLPNAAPDYQQNIAFFPAFPMSMRYLSVVLGRQPLWTGVVISIVSFYLALTYFLRLSRDLLKDEEQSVTAVTLLAAYPFAVFFSAAYTEGLFLVTLMGAVYHFHKNQLWRAAMWGFVCGLTRPNGSLLSIVLGLMAVAPMWDAVRWRPILPPPPGWDTIARRLLAAAAPGFGMLAFSAFIYRLTGNPFMWTFQNVAWGRTYRSLDSLVSDRVGFIANNGLYSYASTQTIDLFYSLAVLLALAAVVPVYRRFGLPFAVFILITILPPMSAGGLLSMGRVTSVLFPVFLWMGAAVPARHRVAWIGLFALLQGFVAVMFFTWRPLDRPRRHILQNRMVRRITLLALAVALTAFSLTPRVTAEQASAATSRINAEKSFRGGRYDEVETIAKALPKDELIATYYALGVAARGDYAKAESILQPFAAANSGGEAALELGLLQLHVGKRTEGRRTLQLVLMADGANPSARELLRAARATRALNRIDDAQAFFRDAIALAPTDPRINTEWGELFLEKYNKAEAAKSYQEALKVDPEYGPALLGMAKALADENPPQAVVFAQRVLKQNPNDAGAEIVLAQVAIYQDKKADVKAALDRILEFNPKHLEGLSMKAAMAYVEGRDAEYQAAVAEALRIHPTYGEIHRVVGEITAHYYRFDEAVEQTRKAIALDKENIRAVADLGAQLLRTGDERNARRNLEQAFRIDRWDVQTYNMLEMLDRLEPYDTLKEGDMIIRLPPGEAPVMRNYVPALAKESLEALSKRWEFTPKGPILIEMFATHDDFAVRTLGLPGMIGALGACFGRVVTLDSPTVREPGTFNWGETLWHEMAHVITLQLSGNRLPRWLSEGTSVFEERRARPDWGREMDIPFARAMDRGAVIKIRELNSGFSSSATINFAYYQASLVVEHIHDTYGQRKLRALIQTYADGSDTEAAIKLALGIDIDELQKGFDQSLEKRYATLRRALKAPEGLKEGMTVDQVKAIAAANPDNFAAQMALGDALAASSPDAAIAAFEKAAQIVPNMPGEDSPQAAIAAIAMKKGDKVRARKALETLVGYSHTDIQSARELVSLLDTAKEPASARLALNRIVSVDPFDGAAHSQLGKLAMSGSDTAEAVRLFRVALAAKPLDKASAHADLAEALFKAGQRDEARKQVLEALLIAPTYTRAQDLLLKLQEGSR